MIIMYDLDDNILETFNNCQECADYFGVSKGAIYCHITNNRKGKTDKKRDVKNKRWVRLFKCSNNTKKAVIMKDLKGNFICRFDDYKKCGEYFGSNARVVATYLSNIKAGRVNRKRDHKNQRWVKLYKEEDDD